MLTSAKTQAINPMMMNIPNFKKQHPLQSLLTGLLLLVHFAGYAQTEPVPNTGPRVGDTIPAFAVPLRMPGAEKIKLDQYYRSGLLIINFWATWCAPCRSELSRLDSLSKSYSGKLQVLSVAYEDSVKIKAFLKTNPDIPTSGLHMITNDTMFGNYFKHRLLPHNIWVNQKGVIVAITGKDEITPTNIDRILHDTPIPMGAKTDNLKFSWEEQFHLKDSSYQYRSLISNYVDGIPSGQYVRGNHQRGMKRFFAFNLPILDLFWFAYTQNTNYYTLDHRLIRIETKDSTRFYRPDQIHHKSMSSKYKTNTEWEKKNAYCYDLTLPRRVTDTQFYSYVLNDLERMFHIAYRTEYKKMLCNVVTLTPEGKNRLNTFKTNPDTLGSVSFWKNQLVIKHATIGEMIRKIVSNWKPGDDLWVDQTQIGFPINLTITFDQNKPINLETVKQKLGEYGFVFRHQELPYPIMVLKDLNTTGI